MPFAAAPAPLTALLSQTEFADDCTIAFNVNLLQISEQIPSVTDHLLETTAAMEVLWIGLQMLGQVVDAVRQNRNLHFGRAGIALMSCILLDHTEFFFFLHDAFSPFCKFNVSLSDRRVKTERTAYDPETGLTSYSVIIPHVAGFVKCFFTFFSTFLFMGKNDILSPLKSMKYRFFCHSFFVKNAGKMSGKLCNVNQKSRFDNFFEKTIDFFFSL